jgi:hypothetical protein
MTVPTSSLLELLPRVPCKAYRVTVEMRQEEAPVNPIGHLGLFFAHEEIATFEGRQHFYAKASFVDRGGGSIDPPNSGPAERRFQVQLAHLGTAARAPVRSATCGSGLVVSYLVDPARQGTGQWRRFSVEVRPDQFRGCWDRQMLELVPSRVLRSWRPALVDGWPDLVNLDLRFPTQGALGIFTYGVSLTVRRLVVEPLEDP